MNGRARLEGRSSWYIAAGFLVSIGIATTARQSHADEPTGSPLARAALATCYHASTLSEPARTALLVDAATEAEAAIAAMPEDPVAHFAAFCAGGRRLEAQGLSMAAVLDLHHARQALETALRLLPEYADALAAKGVMLLRLPRLLGGDTELGVHLLRRAATLAPNNAATQQLLTQLVPVTKQAVVTGHARCD